jgi:hypothetical protein
MQNSGPLRAAGTVALAVRRTLRIDSNYPSNDAYAHRIDGPALEKIGSR